MKCAKLGNKKCSWLLLGFNWRKYFGVVVPNSPGKVMGAVITSFARHFMKRKYHFPQIVGDVCRCRIWIRKCMRAWCPNFSDCMFEYFCRVCLSQGVILLKSDISVAGMSLRTWCFARNEYRHIYITTASTPRTLLTFHSLPFLCRSDDSHIGGILWHAHG